MALACAVLVGLSSGCEATSSPATGPGADLTTSDGHGGGGQKPSCALVPATTVRSTLGIDVSEPAEIASASVVECTYMPTVGGLNVVVRFQTDESAAAFALGRQGFDTSGQPTTDVSGLADEAYSSSVEFGDNVTNTLVARDGSVEVLVAADASVEDEKALVQQIFDSLR